MQRNSQRNNHYKSSHGKHQGGSKRYNDEGGYGMSNSSVLQPRNSNANRHGGQKYRPPTSRQYNDKYGAQNQYDSMDVDEFQVHKYVSNMPPKSRTNPEYRPPSAYYQSNNDEFFQKENV